MSSGEDSILKRVNAYFPNNHTSFLLGRGDDCALISVPCATGLRPECDTNINTNTREHDRENKKETYNLKNNKKDCAEKDCAQADFEKQNHAKKTVSHTPPHLLAITSDVFAQNAHFRTRYFTPYEIGHKALAVNISDLASNGALPSSFSLNLTLTDAQDNVWIEGFFQGMSALANTYHMGLSGGDLAKVPISLSKNEPSKGQDKKNLHLQEDTDSGLNIAITALGDYSHGGLPLLRCMAFTEEARPIEPSDYCLFVIGEIGLARTGLFLLEETKNAHDVKNIRYTYPKACNAHLLPTPLVHEGIFLSQFAHKHPLYCMDISDGLMRDIPRLLAHEGIFSFKNLENMKTTRFPKGIIPFGGGFGRQSLPVKSSSSNADFGRQSLPVKNTCLQAHIHIQETDICEEVQRYAREKNIAPTLFAYKGGEDYGLLGACSHEAFKELTKAWKALPEFARLWKVGEVQSAEENSITLNGRVVLEQGFDHFTV